MEGHKYKSRALALALVAREQHGQNSRFAGAAAKSKGLWQRMAMDPQKGLLTGHKGASNEFLVRVACYITAGV